MQHRILTFIIAKTLVYNDFFLNSVYLMVWNGLLSCVKVGIPSMT